MAMVPTEDVVHTLIYGGVRATGKTVTLRIMRFDGLVYDWDADEFVAFGSPGIGTIAKNSTEIDATNDPGAYYWRVGAGSAPNGVFPASFALDGEYRFEIVEVSLSYDTAHAGVIRKQRLVGLLAAQGVTNDKYLAEGANDNYELKEDDGETPILSKNVRDKSGGSITIPPNVPARETST